MRPLETPLEDMLRGVFRAKAGEVSPDAVPPLRLPARNWGSFPAAYGGAGRTGRPARRGWQRWPGWLAPTAFAVLVAALVAGFVAVSDVMHGPQATARHQQRGTATRNEAAAWVAAQVSRTAIVSCDPAMCSALKAHGIPATGLDQLRPGAADPLGSDVIVATAAVRSQFGGRLSSRYAPAVIASFGAGDRRIDIRAIAPGGAAAYRSALSEDLQARTAAGAQLLRNKRIVASATARRLLSAGLPDSRLLITIAALGAMRPVAIVAFGDSGPGADPGSPLRSADLAQTERGAAIGSAAFVRALRAFLSAQSAPFRPARVEVLRLPGGKPVLRVEFAAPSPLGLLVPPQH